MKASLWRIFRTAIPVIWTAIVPSLQVSKVWLIAGPLLSGIGKFIRDKHPDGSYDWVPF